MSTVYFSPYSAIWKHSEIELAHFYDESFESKNVIFLSCGKIFNFFCNSMAAYGKNENSSEYDKSHICNLCIKTLKFKKTMFPINVEFVDDYFRDVDRGVVKQFISSINRENWQESTFFEINIGRLALYEIQMRYKLDSLDLDDQVWQYYLKQLEYCAVVVIAANNFFLKNRIDKVIVYNDLYSLNQSFLQIASKYGAVGISLQASGPTNDMYSRYSVDTRLVRSNQLFSSPDWTNRKSTPLTAYEVFQIYRYLISLLKAKSFWVYSKKTQSIFFRSSMRNHYKIPRESKVILLTLSSLDEIVGEQFQLNKTYSQTTFDQLGMVSKLIDYCTDKPDVFLIIRPHPREFANKRDNVESSSGKKLIDFYQAQKLPENIYVESNPSKISMYSCFFVSDVVLNIISSAGIEALAMGIPVVAFENEFFTTYPKELNIYTNSDFIGLDSALQNPNLLSQNQVLAFRWLWLKFFESNHSKFESKSRIYFKVMNLLRGFYIKYTVVIKKNADQSDNHLLNHMFKSVSALLKNFNSVITWFSRRMLKIATMFKIYSRFNFKLEKILIKFTIYILKHKVFRVFN